MVSSLEVRVGGSVVKLLKFGEIVLDLIFDDK